MLSNMESMSGPPTPGEAAAALADAEAGRSSLADRVVVPRLFLVSIGAAVAVQIGTTAVGLAGTDASSRWLLVAGLVLLLLVSVVQLVRFRAANGIWLGGLVSRVVGGTATAASVSYAAALGAALWAAFAEAWWLVPLCAVAGGVAYALSGLSWLRAYHAEPGTHSRGESAAWVAVLGVLALAGLVLLVAQR
jgi:hypothetical protein